jgi:hypothetical protein
MPELKGGCLCGAVRYTTTAEPVMSAVCHCRDCQRFTGSAFGALVGVPKEALSIHGTMKTFTSLGGSGEADPSTFLPGMRLVDCRGTGDQAGPGNPQRRHARRPEIGNADARDILRRCAALGASDRRHAALCQSAGLRWARAKGATNGIHI